MADKKVTKKEVLTAIYNLIAEDAEYEGVTAADIYNYVDTTIEQLNAKNEKAKERAAAKKAEGDEFRAAIEDVLTDEYQSGDDIVAAIIDDYPEATKSKVTARMTQLINLGVAHKATAKREDGKKVIVYAKGAASETEEE